MTDEKKRKLRKLEPIERVAVIIAIVILTAFLIWIGDTHFTIWKFDAIILGGFLLGDSLMRWFLDPKNSKSLMEHFRNIPKQARLALTYSAFFVVVMVAGDVTGFAQSLVRIAYGEPFPLPLIVIFTSILSLWLYVDFRNNYYN